MSAIKWDDKDFIIKLLISKYQVPDDKVSRLFRMQLIKKMSTNDLKAEIKNLTSNDAPASHNDSELRALLQSIVTDSK